jgi:hypothetical protein
MKITLKLKDQQYMVTIDGRPYIFMSSIDAWEFIFAVRKEVA